MMVLGVKSEKTNGKSEKKSGWRKRLTCAVKLHVELAQTRSHKLQTCASYRSSGAAVACVLEQSTGTRKVKQIHHRVSVVFTFALCLFTLFIFSCEESFQPVQENDRYFFSINGVLDASADTQWVRVMPVRESLNLEPDLQVPEVILRHEQSGQSVAMRDSVFQYSGGRYAYNFWTTMPIEPEQTYHLTVKGADGRASSTEATLPKDFPLPQFSTHEFEQDILLVRGVEKLADVQVIYRIKINRSGTIFETAFPYLQNSIYTPPSQYRVAIDPGAPQTTIRETYCGITVIERNLFIASGGPGWPDFVSLDRHAIALPDGVTSVENGVGFLGGIISKTFPYINTEGEDGLFEVLCP